MFREQGFTTSGVVLVGPNQLSYCFFSGGHFLLVCPHAGTHFKANKKATSELLLLLSNLPALTVPTLLIYHKRGATPEEPAATVHRLPANGEQLTVNGKIQTPKFALTKILN